jgi:GT2 family glycosyltransferase
MKVSVICLTRSINTLLRTCIQTFIDHNDKSNYHFHIADTGSPKEDIESFRNHFTGVINFTLHEDVKYNFGTNCNFLVDNSTEPILYFLNDDIEFKDNLPDTMLRWTVSSNNYGAIGCVMRYGNGTIQHVGQLIFSSQRNSLGWEMSHAFLKFEDLPEKVSSQIAIKAFGITGGNLMVTREHFLQAGKFNPAYEHCFEDVELNIKLLAMGKVNVCIINDDKMNRLECIHYESVTRREQGQLNPHRNDVLRLHECIRNNLTVIKPYMMELK